MARTVAPVVVATLLAAALAVAGVFVARAAGVDIDFLPTLITALIVGGFLSLLLFAPRRGENEEPEGFDVVSKTRKDDEIEVEERD